MIDVTAAGDVRDRALALGAVMRGVRCRFVDGVFVDLPAPLDPVMANFRRGITDDEVREIRDLSAAGLSSQEIIDRMGLKMTVKSVRKVELRQTYQEII